MPLEETTKVVYNKATKLIRVEAFRTKKGFEFFLQSTPIWEFFKSVSPPDSPPVHLKQFGIDVFDIFPGKVPFIQDVDFEGMGYGGLLTEGGLSGVVFRAVGLGEGVVVKDESSPLPSNGYGETVVLALKRAASELWGQYLAPWEMTLELTSRQVMTE